MPPVKGIGAPRSLTLRSDGEVEDQLFEDSEQPGRVNRELLGAADYVAGILSPLMQGNVRHPNDCALFRLF